MPQLGTAVANPLSEVVLDYSRSSKVEMQLCWWTRSVLKLTEAQNFPNIGNLTIFEEDLRTFEV